MPTRRWNAALAVEAGVHNASHVVWRSGLRYFGRGPLARQVHARAARGPPPSWAKTWSAPRGRMRGIALGLAVFSW